VVVAHEQEAVSHGRKWSALPRARCAAREKGLDGSLSHLYSFHSRRVGGLAMFDRVFNIEARKPKESIDL
jgi:hypothetical protein